MVKKRKKKRTVQQSDRYDSTSNSDAEDAPKVAKKPKRRRLVRKWRNWQVEKLFFIFEFHVCIICRLKSEFAILAAKSVPVNKQHRIWNDHLFQSLRWNSTTRRSSYTRESLLLNQLRFMIRPSFRHKPTMTHWTWINRWICQFPKCFMSPIPKRNTTARKKM